VEDGFLPDQNREKHHAEARQQVTAGFFIVFGIAMLVLAGSWLPRTIAIKSGGGVYGSYTVGDPSLHYNGNDVCSLHDGTFRSDDGKVVLTGVQVLHPSEARVEEGETFRAFSVGESLWVHTEEDRDDMPWPLIFIGLVGLIGIVQGSLLFRRIRKARRPGA
jgi:hypothetical protein